MSFVASLPAVGTLLAAHVYKWAPCRRVDSIPLV